MKLYIAAPFNNREKSLEYKARLEAYGHTITARWLTDHHEKYEDMNLDTLAKEARVDLEDILAADAVLLMNTYPCSPGRMFEFGFAVAFGRPVLIYGDTTKTVFAHLPGVTTRVGDLDKWLEYDFNPEAQNVTEPSNGN